MSTTPPETVARRYRLTADEAATLVVAQMWLLARDLAAERSSPRRDVKLPVWDDVCDTTLQVLRTQAGPAPPPPPQWDPSILAAAQWLERLGVALQGTAGVRLAWLQSDDVTRALVERVSPRARALLLLIELMAWQPFGQEAAWNVAARQDGLKQFVAWLPGLTEDHYATMRYLFREHLGRRSLGAQLVLWMSAEVPIQAVEPTASELARVAVPSPGMAVLGGDAGVLEARAVLAGGTSVLVRPDTDEVMSGLPTAVFVYQVVKLQVLTEMVILGEQGDLNGAAAVVEALQHLHDELSEQVDAHSQLRPRRRFWTQRADQWPWRRGESMWDSTSEAEAVTHLLADAIEHLSGALENSR